MAACPVLSWVVAFHWTLASLSTLLLYSRDQNWRQNFRCGLTSAEWSGIATSLFLLWCPLQMQPSIHGCLLQQHTAHSDWACPPAPQTPFPQSCSPVWLIPACAAPCVFWFIWGFLCCAAYTQPPGFKVSGGGRGSSCIEISSLLKHSWPRSSFSGLACLWYNKGLSFCLNLFGAPLSLTWLSLHQFLKWIKNHSLDHGRVPWHLYWNILLLDT